MERYTLKDNDAVVSEMQGREYVLKMRDMPQEDKPREKLLKQGPATLSVFELLAVVLNTGTKKEGVLQMSQRIIKEYGDKSLVAETNPGRMAKDLEIPVIKSCQIVACCELGRRFYQKGGGGLTLIRTAKDVFEYLTDMRNLPKEHLRGIYLNTHNRVIHDEVISIGTINSNIVHPREVFRPAIEYGAAAVVLAHNHPSGNPKPSPMDVEITEQLVAAGKIIGINVLDHVVISKEKFESVNVNYN
jgi:DNA repair protein RadC